MTVIPDTPLPDNSPHRKRIRDLYHAEEAACVDRLLLELDSSDALRQQYRDEVLATTTEDFKTLGEVLAQMNNTATVVVLGSADAIAKANDSQGDWLLISKVM